jgi:hypothetical protein
VEPLLQVIENKIKRAKIPCAKACAKPVQKVPALWSLFVTSTVFNRFHNGSTGYSCGKNS